jgi:hypothetical protein
VGAAVAALFDDPPAEVRRAAEQFKEIIENV